MTNKVSVVSLVRRHCNPGNKEKVEVHD
jgi:hypothetical protein